MRWEAATRCTCWTDDTRQPEWGHEPCGGLGVVYEAPVDVRVLFRGQAKWTGRHSSGELAQGEAQLTTPLDVVPTYVDDRVRDRFSTTAAIGDLEAGRVFYPAAEAVPFIFAGAQRAWRVQLQSLEQKNRLQAQP